MSTSSQAGKASGRERASRAKWRRLSVLRAFARLKPKYQMQPYSKDALKALEQELEDDRNRVEPRDEEWGIVRSWPVRSLSDLDGPPPPKRVPPPDLKAKYERLFIEHVDDVVEKIKAAPKPRSPSREAPSRETIIKDLKALGIRSKYRKKHSG